MVTKKDTKECPYCKETIKAEAIKCKHCSSQLKNEQPSHEGVCPYCKEEIHEEAIKCKHCKSSLKSEHDCGCSEKEQPSVSYARKRGRNGFSDSDYGNCYLDCSYDYPLDSLDQNLCFKRCDRRMNYPLFHFGGGGFMR